MRAIHKFFKSWLVVLALFVIVPSVVWILFVKLEGEKPSIKIDLTSPSLRASQSISVSVSDSKSGLRRIWIGLLKDGREMTLLEKDYPQKGFLSGGKTHQTSHTVDIEPKKMGITDGKAILRMVARDYSWRGWWHGNRTYIEKDVMIDTKPPGIAVLSRLHNIRQGGSGLVIYKTSEPCSKSGVHVGGSFFPGHSGYFKDKNIVLAFFALNYKQGAGTELFVEATDYAGNSTRSGFLHHIKKKVYKKDLINISDRFLHWKMPEFDIENPTNSKTPLIDKFLRVNNDLRRANYEEITGLVENTDRIMHWEGPFLRLPNSARKAGFADHRVYKYNGQQIDRQVHLGIDLASVANSPVPASNSGKILFAGPLGIYGNTVVIDHGFSLLSMYSHLSSINAQKGQMVSKGEVIGHTGSTGLAGGDHLHFSLLVHKTFVNPIEWWDAAWIKNNILTKIETAKSRLEEG